MATPTHLDPAHLQKLMDEAIAQRDKVLALPNSFIDKCMGAGIGALGHGVAGAGDGGYANYKNALNQQHAHSIGGGAGGSGAHTHQYTAAQARVQPGRWSEENLYSMLASRLGWGVDGKQSPFNRVVPHRVTAEKVVIFVVINNDALLLSDEALMYPSDALITQIRLLVEAAS